MPDLCSSRSHGKTWVVNHAYGKAKCASQQANHYEICQDSVRIGIFGKNARDKQNMEGLGAQIVGRMVSFSVSLFQTISVLLKTEQ